MVRSAAKRRVSNHEAAAPAFARSYAGLILRDTALRAVPQDEEQGPYVPL
jgi:hypothetical protein